MLFFGVAKYDNVVSDPCYSLATLNQLVDPVLEHVLCHSEAKWHPHELVPTKRRVEHCEVTGRLVKLDIPVSALCVEDWTNILLH